MPIVGPANLAPLLKFQLYEILKTTTYEHKQLILNNAPHEENLQVEKWQRAVLANKLAQDEQRIAESKDTSGSPEMRTMTAEELDGVRKFQAILAANTHHRTVYEIHIPGLMRNCHCLISGEAKKVLAAYCVNLPI